VLRLFSSFARGWPGVGLLLMRLVAAIALIDRVVITLQGGTHTKPLLLDILSLCLALLLLAGLWTPIAGVIATVVEVWSAFAEPGDIWTHILLGTLGAALALLGPGAWSVDAHFFGWKRIDLRDRKS
jgi:hypothetical protein